MDAHEQPPVNQENLARQAAQEIISKIKAIEVSGASNSEQTQEKSDVAIETVRDYRLAQEALARLRTSENPSQPNEELQKKIQKEQQNIGLSLIKACTLADNDVPVARNAEANRILRELSKTSLTISEAVAIEEALGDYLLGKKTGSIIISKGGAIRSDFMKGVDSLISKNVYAADKLLRSLVLRATDFNLTPDELVKSFVPDTPEGANPLNQQPETISSSGNPQIDREMMESGLGNDLPYYRSTFTTEQLKLVETFYSPTAFAEYVKELGNQTSDGSRDPAKVLTEKQKLREHIKKYYEKNNKPLSPEKLEEEFERHWGEEVSKRMKDEVSGLIHHLFLILQTKAPHKFYEEVLQHTDPFFGPGPILNKMENAIRKLMTTTAEIERKADSDNPLYRKLKKLNLYIHQEKDPWIDERDLDENGHGKLYPRIKPIPIGKEVPVSKFVENLHMLIDHTTHSNEYFHNGRAIYGHPAGEKGFYQHLGEFAEGLKGTDIDEILMLPNGDKVIQAYQLYEKFLKEDFASIDWRHRPDQFQPRLESVNSKLENELIQEMQSIYPELTDLKIRSIVNSAIGISRSLTLSEPETSSYADAVDATGRGMVASYSTNDAQSLNVFNSLHNALRWQGEHNWNLMYFMPVEGRNKMWNHEEAKKNMADYMGSFEVGKGRGKNLPKKLFVDILTDINKAGGPQGKRKGWRNEYAFDGHYVIDNKSNKIKVPETFRAMEAIGYEGVSSFIETIAGKRPDLLKANKVKSNLGDDEKAKNTNDLVTEREKLFRYIFDRYIDVGQISENPTEVDPTKRFDKYLAKLRELGEKKALEHIEKNGVSILNEASWDEQVTFATSQIFMETALAHYTAAKMPTLLLRIGRNRFTENGLSSRELMFRSMKDYFREKVILDIQKKGGGANDENEINQKCREYFNSTMKSLEVAEMLFRKQISDLIREEMSFNEEFSLDQIDKVDGLKDKYRLNEKIIRDLLSKNTKGGKYKSEEEIKRVIELWRHMNDGFFKKDGDGLTYLDKKAFGEIKDYPFTIGLEDTDMTLVAYRGTGPRMVARAIKDTASLEQTCTPWLMNMPNIMSEIAINGKHDFSPLIEYLLKAKKAINDVHGSEDAQEFIYKVSGGIINYFKRDGMAKPLFGLLRFNQINSIAGEYASSSTAVWEWESKEIDHFCIALRSHRLLPGNAYDLNKTGKEDGTMTHIGGKLEDIWWINPITKKPFKTIFKKRHVDFVYNVARLRKEHGADWKAIGWDYFNKYIPLFLMILIGKYIKDALEEMMGKKKG